MHSYKEPDNWYIVVLVLFLILGLIVTFMAWQDCGLSNSLLYGKNLVWAWYFGYCE